MALLSILSDQEKRLFEAPPALTASDRVLCFSLTPNMKRSIARMENHHVRAGFLIQLAYFRAKARFFTIKKTKKRDLRYVQSILQCGEINLDKYNSTINARHRSRILSLLGWNQLSSLENSVLESYALRQAHNQIKPRELFIGLVDQCWKHQLCVPSYTELQHLISASINHSEKRLIDHLVTYLDVKHISTLDALFFQHSRKDERNKMLVTDLKKIEQGLKPGKIQKSVDEFYIVKKVFTEFETLYSTWDFSVSSTEYYANWFIKADYQQQQQLKHYRGYLHLLAFIKHQFYSRHDALVDGFIKCVNSALSTATSKLAQRELDTKKERQSALQVLHNSHKSLSEFGKAVIAIVESKDATPNEKYFKIEALANALEEMSNEEENKLALIDDYLSEAAKNRSYYELLTLLSNKLQRRVSRILLVLQFDEPSSDPDLIEAIQYFRSNETIGLKAPIQFLSNTDKDNLYRDDKLNVPLYKCLLFVHVAKGIKSNKLNLKHCYRYRALQDYLIDEKHWKSNKEQILHDAGLSHFADGKAYLATLKVKLSEKFQSVNETILNHRNPYFKTLTNGKPSISTPSIDSSNKEFISSTLSQEGFTSIRKVLSEINAATNFTQSLEHFSQKSSKMKPTEETLLAGIISKGCNIGVRKLAGISTGINEHVLHNAVNWCLELNTVIEANRKIVKMIHGLDLANHDIYKPEIIHSGSDGRKVNVSVDSLHANYSFKYFGRDKGVTMYTFVDERQSIFHSTVFSSSDREAAYVIDGLLQNDTPTKQIHSTDTHGYSEQIFSATHFMGVDFAPRLKNVGSQRLVSFSSRKTLQKKGYALLPSRTVDVKLILRHWDDILRFMATIKTNHTSASQLFLRLNSYSRSNPLYRALQEFGRIIKSNFILTYYDDVTLRQQIQKQLNRVEQTNKFAHAVFFDNDQAFQVGTKEEQQIATACQVLLQNSIILWNYMYLSNLIIETPDKSQQKKLLESISQGSVITWSHVNLRGEYDFTRRAKSKPEFDIKKIKTLKL